MPRDFDREGHPKMRKALFIILALILVIVMGRVTVEGFSFVVGNAVKNAGIKGDAYTITGGSCPTGEDSADCCEKACVKWCGAKERGLVRAGVIDPMKVKCKCVCTTE